MVSTKPFLSPFLILPCSPWFHYKTHRKPSCIILINFYPIPPLLSFHGGNVVNMPRFASNEKRRSASLNALQTLFRTSQGQVLCWTTILVGGSLQSFTSPWRDFNVLRFRNWFRAKKWFSRSSGV